MTFISTIPEADAPPDVRRMYQKNLDAMGYIPNYSRAFSHRPQVMEAWGALLGSIRASMETRRYELVTLAAARALKSSYCMLAHGSILRDQFYSADELAQIAHDPDGGPLSAAERAIMRFAAQIARDATAITQDDIDALRGHGFTDPEIFDIVAAATARCFFSKTLDALGVEADARYREMEAPLRDALTVGRPISSEAMSPEGEA